MHFLRKSALGLSTILLSSGLLAFGLLFGAERVFNQPANIKTAVAKSGIYTTLVSDVLTQSRKSQQTGQGNGLPLNTGQVSAIINQSFTPVYLQKTFEAAVDGTYAWLQGKAPKLNFNVNIANAQARLADGAVGYVTSHLSTLPPCAAGTPAGAIDPFTTTCLPPRTDVAAVAAKVRQNITTGDFSQLSADNIKTNNGQPLAAAYSYVPTYYRATIWAIYILGIVCVLLAVAVLFLSQSRRAGLKHVAIIALTVGTSLTTLGLLVKFILVKMLSSLGKGAAPLEPLQEKAISIVKTLLLSVNLWWLGIGIALLILGLVGLITLHFIKPKNIEPAPESEPSEHHKQLDMHA